MPAARPHGLGDATCYGIGLDDPSITTLPGGRYAVAQFKGPSSAIAEAWTRMTREWLPASGLQWDERPCFERFSAATAMDPATGEFSCEIGISVRPL